MSEGAFLLHILSHAQLSPFSFVYNFVYPCVQMCVYVITSDEGGKLITKLLSCQRNFINLLKKHDFLDTAIKKTLHNTHTHTHTHNVRNDKI